MNARKCFSLILALLLCLSTAAPALGAETAHPQSGYCGTEFGGASLIWILDEEGNLTITGTGRMADYPFNGRAPSQPWGREIKSVFVEEGVTSIGDGAFGWCSYLTEISIPASVTEISQGAFYFGSYGANYGTAMQSTIHLYYAGSEEQWKQIGYAVTSPYIIVYFDCDGFESPQTSGACGPDLVWTRSPNCMTIRGTGTMQKFSSNSVYGTARTNAPWFTSNVINIESGVESIGDYAFCGSWISVVSIPASAGSRPTAA